MKSDNVEVEEKYKSTMKTEAQITAEILDMIKKSVDISGKESGRHKIYLLKNGNVAYVRHSDIRYSTNRPRGTYYFVVSIDKFREYKERFRLVLACGSVDKTLIIPPGDIENLFKNAGISTDNKWYFYVSGDIRLGDVDLSKYLNRWELLNDEKMRLGDVMKDKIRESESISKICDIVSGFSRENRKCNHIRLCNDLYAKGFLKCEILEALKYLEEKGSIYKIVYVDLYIKERYKENDLDEGDELLMDTFNAIKDFAKKHNWQYGLKKSELCGELLEKEYTKDNINDALTLLEEEKVIYKKFFIYWFTNEYKGCSIDGDCIEDDDYVIYMPDNIEEVEDIDIEKTFGGTKVEYPKMEDVGDDGGNIYSDIHIKAESLVKKWKELKDKKEEMERRRQEEIDLQKELEQKREDSIGREKELTIKISEVEEEKDTLEKLFEPIRLKYDQDGKSNKSDQDSENNDVKDNKDSKDNKSDQDSNSDKSDQDSNSDKSDQDSKNNDVKDNKDSKDNKSDQDSNSDNDNIDEKKTENREGRISIDATETLSELTNEDIVSLLEKKIVWHSVMLETWNSLYIEDVVLNKGDNIVVVDVTRKPWVKQLCCVSDNDDGRVSVTTEITRRHLVHRRCKTPVTVKGDSLYCDKCKQPLPSKPLPNKSVGRWSPLAGDFLKADKFTIGEALINGENGHVALVDMEYIRRSEHDEKERLKSYDK